MKWIAMTAVVVACAAVTERAEAQSYIREENARVRFGIDGGLGFGAIVGSGDPVYFGAIAASGRIGVQFNALVGLYYQMGGWAIGRDVGDDYRVWGDWSHTANVDFTFNNFFQIGFGAGFDLFGSGLNAYPSFDARMAFMIGTTGPGSRGAFQIGVKSHFMLDTSGRDLLALAIPIAFAGFELF